MGENRLIKVLMNKWPECKKCFSPGVNQQVLQELEGIVGFSLPTNFKGLYLEINGEKQYIGSILGFELMSIEKIIREYKILQDAPYSVMSNEMDKVKEGKFQKGWVPFADDGSGSFIVMDLEPASKGSIGQIITVDRDSDISYVLASSLEELIEKISDFLEDGRLALEEEEYFKWGRGHLFDDISLYFNKPESKEEWIAIDPYFAQFFKDEVVDNCVTKQNLQLRKRLYLPAYSDREVEEVSLNILEHMPNLKELIIHINKIKDFSALTKLKGLKQLVILSTAFTEENLSYLRALTNLSELTLVKMRLDNFEKMGLEDNLRRLNLIDIQASDYSYLANYKKLIELKIEKGNCNELNFLEQLHKLQQLELEKVRVKDIYFLEKLPNLETLKISTKIEDEESLKMLSSCQKLKELEYPIGNMNLIAKCKQLRSLSIDAKNYSYLEILSDTQITSISVENADSEGEVQSVIEDIQRYITLTSYGYKMNCERR